MHVSWEGADVWFPTIASPARPWADAYGAPDSDVAIFPHRYLLRIIDLPARIPKKDVLISYVTRGPVSNCARVLIPKADRQGLRRPNGILLFVVHNDGTIT